MDPIRLPLLTSLCLAGLAATGAAQNARAPIDLTDNSILGELAAISTSKGSNSLVITLNQGLLGRSTLNCFTSDGRGTEWVGPIRVSDPGSTTKAVSDPSYVQFGLRNAYCIWEEAGDLFFSRSTDEGATWRVPRSIFPATGPARMCVAEGAAVGADEIYILCEDVRSGRLRLISSLDSGRNFRVRRLTALGENVGDFDVRGTGSEVHVAYVSDVSGSDDVYYTRSSDGGLNFDIAATAIDPSGVGTGSAAGSEIHMALDGSTVAVALLDDTAGAAPQGLYVNVSQDAGLTFDGAVQVGTYTLGVDTVGEHELQRCGSNLVASWTDDRNGGEEVFIATSTDDGATWTETAALGSGQRLRAANRGPSAQDGCGFAFSSAGSGPAFAAISHDDGLIFEAVDLSDSEETLGDCEISYNELYGNFITTWRAGADTIDTFVGGVRPQTLTPVGWVFGPNMASFDLSGFDPATSQAWVIGAFTPGSLALPDGRVSGLGFDLWTTLTIRLAVAGAYSADLVDGAGSTPALQQDFSGFQFAFIGVGINGSSVGELTDVVLVDLRRLPPPS